MLVLAKAYPVVSNKYQELVCVAGITESGELRRLYPVPWELFWNHNGFKKKSWIEYESLGPKKEDTRRESIKVDPETIVAVREAGFKEILELITPHVASVEDHVRDFKETNKSLGFVRPHIMDFIREERTNRRMDELKLQQTLAGKSAVRIDVLSEKLSYVYKCHPEEDGTHTHMCEDWELGALYRQYQDKDEAFEKCRQKFLFELPKKRDFHLMLGTHYKWKTPMIISVLYPRKDDL